MSNPTKGNMPASAEILKEQLATQINKYDTLIAKLVKCHNARSLGKVTFFITASSGVNKIFNEIFHLGENADLPVPVIRVMEFLQGYCEDLINERLKLIVQLTILEAREPVFANILDNAELHCPMCVKPTDHHLHQSDMGVHWQCDECGNINPNAEID